MKKIVLFEGIRDEGGELVLVVFNTSVATSMDKKFWQRIVDHFEKGDLESFDDEERLKVREMVDIIKKAIKDW
ncbi:hypothetical protein ES702_05561 [subsurface metagenome]